MRLGQIKNHLKFISHIASEKYLNAFFSTPKRKPHLFPRFPTEYVIDTSNICNLKCLYCHTGQRKKNVSRGVMKLETFRVILEKIDKYAAYIEFMNWGEPFYNPHLLQMVSLASAKGIKTSVDSNFSLRDFDDSEAEAIVRSGLWRIRGSIDGASQETYGLYRRGGDFERALGNIARIQQAKNKLLSSTPLVEWQFLVNKKNEHEIEKAKERASQLGVDIYFMPMSVWGQDQWLSTLHKLEKEGEFRKDDWMFRANPTPGAKHIFFTSRCLSLQAVDYAFDFHTNVPDVCRQLLIG